MPSSLNTHLGSHIINPLIGRRRGMVSNIFEGILGGSNLPIDAHIDEPIERQGLDHGHVGDNCQHKQFGCDQIGYHCVQTAEHSYSQCTDGQSAHCHCKRADVYTVTTIAPMSEEQVQQIQSWWILGTSMLRSGTASVTGLLFIS
ncbi:hypothetical protein KP79_PYT05881 [Mizuhopecten yessoensis]|uniref:Uncharacterized protein n=1 Tax=Mizuhopecten yessoensis TaxID=6573 RepID=A0A210QIA4_MIZYE|nr:hypothetical protein KP79_PYT05881 [Mizuhopecten yessoensis]